MAATTENIRRPSFYEGLYLRAKTRTRFRGWGDWSKRQLANAPAPEMERAPSTLTEWLRMAHLLLDSDGGDGFAQRDDQVGTPDNPPRP